MKLKTASLKRSFKPKIFFMTSDFDAFKLKAVFGTVDSEIFARVLFL